MCPAIYKTVAEGAEWENLYYKFWEMNKVVNVRNPSGSSRAPKTEVTRIVTDLTQQKLSVGKRFAKSCEMRTSRVRLLRCRRRCGKWNDADPSTGRSRS